MNKETMESRKEVIEMLVKGLREVADALEEDAKIENEAAFSDKEMTGLLGYLLNAVIQITSTCARAMGLGWEGIMDTARRISINEGAEKNVPNGDVVDNGSHVKES